ncbi:MarR family winged helix-turn-helix transcriptional regulator [Niveispirillum sp. KHB5.9]|uniref:MarR family winged helix-turn-helix transcriptional regulator n=1 Tax=Niveispirillum sp. KHB5.9 TaxID=3400269 RepID=UPI003A86526C
MKPTSPPPAFTLSFLDPDTRPAFVALLADRLAQQVTEDSAQHLARLGFRTPAICVSAVMYLHRHGPSSLTELAQAYGQQHQLVTLRIAALEEQGLAIRQPDPKDSRRRLILLTPDGQAEAERLSTHLALMTRALDGLAAQLGADLPALLQSAIDHLYRDPLSRRIDALNAETP